MRRVKFSIAAMFLSVALFSLYACQPKVDGIKSPSGRFTVQFEVTKDYKSQGTDDIDDISYIQYKVTFYDKGNPITSVEYSDVYGWDENAEPKTTDKIVSEFQWSPKEDFVILPEEGWASAPGSPSYKVINLNSSNNWKTGVINMFIETWYGDMLVFGNVKDDCHCQVEMFDGKTGKITVIAAAESPLGYEISDSGDDFLFIKTVLDNCRMQEDEENFHMKCFEYEIPKQELRERPCR